ncbi:MAG TPA: PilX N-terminal domain-containing pilus assembly protein, partial [Vicinamibacterales bacterium]|nr:PilX N-terminal domain-containing pilus assembly protein [Vicinamibacterales bacterium]
MSQPSVRRSSSAGDEGIAMVLSLLFMLLLSALGTAVLLLSRSETLSSVNYRMMSQARYGAESGVHKAAHFLINSYTLPGSGTDPISNYDTSVTPVRYNGQPVILSTLPGVAANYPFAGAQTAFASAVQGSLPVGEATVLYSASATLLSMRQFLPYGSTAATSVVQTWKLTARGSIQGARQAEVEVSAVIERQVAPAHTYALFAMNAGCGELDLIGNMNTDSYDSGAMTFSGGVPVVQAWGGHVGTNGNMHEQGGQTIVKGSLSTPRSGVGTCQSGAITAVSTQSGASISEGIIKLPQAIYWPLPDPPSPTPPTTNVAINGSSTCADVPITSGACTLTFPIAGAGKITLDPQGTPMVLGNVSVNSGAWLVLKAGTYNINSMKLNSGAIIKVSTGPVVFNIAGVGQTTPIDFSAGAVSNTTYDPSNFRMLYAGTNNLKLTGNSTTVSVVYAPASSASVEGNSDFYGSILAAHIHVEGGS